MNTKIQENRAKARTVNFKEQQYVVRTFHHTPDREIPYESLLKPDYWATVAVSLKPGDYINVFGYDRSYAAQLIVTDVDDTNKVWAKVGEIYHVSLVGKVDAGNKKNLRWDELFEVKFGNPHSKFQVLRKSDSEIVQGGFSTEAEGVAWVKNHIKTVGV
jgi:hypothetical protein